MGYEEINLNFGCPSKTVVTKKRGSGFLAYPDELDHFLEEVFSKSDMEISVKTRVGKDNPEEFFQLLDIYNKYPTDGKYILDNDRLIICQSHADTNDLKMTYNTSEVNPLGDWTGGPDVDSGATNRKLGSDMADSVTGGGLHGKDLSKADVSVNIYAWLKAQQTGEPQAFCCAIGDERIDGVPYETIVQIAKDYIDSIGGFEKFAEWGLV
jgi:hypothetical protein